MGQPPISAIARRWADLIPASLIECDAWAIPSILVSGGEGVGYGRQEEWIVLASDRQQRRTVLAKIFRKRWVKRDVAGVIQKEVELDLVIRRTDHERAMLDYTEAPESKRKRMNEPSPAHQGFA